MNKKKKLKKLTNKKPNRPINQTMLAEMRKNEAAEKDRLSILEEDGNSEDGGSSRKLSKVGFKVDKLKNMS
jgi:hypothetical protein